MARSRSARSGRASLLALKTLGPRSVSWLIEAGIGSPDELRRFGPVTAYRRVEALHPTSANRTLLGAIAGALLDCHFAELPGELREQLSDELVRTRTE